MTVPPILGVPGCPGGRGAVVDNSEGEGDGKTNKAIHFRIFPKNDMSGCLKKKMLSPWFDKAGVLLK